MRWLPASDKSSSQQSEGDLLRGPTHVDAGCWRVRTLGDRKIYPDFAIVDLDAVAIILGPLGVVQILEINEGEPTGATSLSTDQHNES